MTRYKCPTCGVVYNHDGCVPFTGVWCSGGQRHTRKQMKEVKPDSDDEYQSILDDMGIAADDPLRFADLD